MPPSNKFKQPTTNDIISLINKTGDTDSFTITGGEPTIRKDVFKILEYINTKYPTSRINFITNGRLFAYSDFLNKFKKVKNLYIKTELHASTAEKHDSITRTPGSFEQASIGIKKLLENNFNVEFRIVISKLNYKDIPNITELVVKEFNKTSRVVIFPIDIIGNAFKNKEKVVIKYTELIPFVETEIDILKQAGINVLLYHIPYCVLNKKYHNYIRKGITVLDRRVALTDICEGCKFEEYCPRVWKTYLRLIGKEEFHKITS